MHTAGRCNGRVKVLGFALRLINTRLSLFLFLFLPQILLPMRLLIPFAARPVNSNGRLEKINGIRCVSSADTKRDVPGRGQWLSKGTTYKYHLVRDLSSSLRRRLLLLLPSLACGVYLDNLPLGGSGIRYGKGASSSRWLSPRWHRVPRLCISDPLLFLHPLLVLLRLLLFSWPPCSSR